MVWSWPIEKIKEEIEKLKQQHHINEIQSVLSEKTTPSK